MRCGLTVLSTFVAMTATFGAPGSVDYPTFNTAKNLYAKHDFRARKAPRLVVKQWLRKPPSTRGKVVLIDFWATWCEPCREAIPDLAKWQRKFGKDLVVIGLSDEKASVVSKFMKTAKMPYAVGVDPSATTKHRVGIDAIPNVLVVSADGIVRWQGFPLDESDPLTESTLAQIIRASKAHAR
ncbi:MAG TPA: TlpA disulfide reductase family protein [Fimbriimonadaceae bacterium]|nr:TlpA disulfide reductase family protein [Fimbriimonadaceae bacterium]